MTILIKMAMVTILDHGEDSDYLDPVTKSLFVMQNENPKGCHTLVFGGETGQSQGGVDSL